MPIGAKTRSLWEDPAYRERMAAAHRGKAMPNATRLALAKANAGRAHSAETRAKISESHRGLYHSDSTKQKISATQLARGVNVGKKNPMYHGTRVCYVENYNALHKKVKELRGRAADHQCVDCDQRAADWSSDTEEYKSIEEFSPRCRKHHMAYDKELHNQTRYATTVR